MSKNKVFGLRTGKIIAFFRKEMKDFDEGSINRLSSQTQISVHFECTRAWVSSIFKNHLSGTEQEKWHKTLKNRSRCLKEGSKSEKIVHFVLLEKQRFDAHETEFLPSLKTLARMFQTSPLYIRVILRKNLTAKERAGRQSQSHKHWL